MAFTLHHNERYLRSLEDFESDVGSHPANAQVFATNDFLDVLYNLIKEANDQTKDVTDHDESYESEIELLKQAVRAFATVVPYVFSSVCQNEAETRLWQNVSAVKEILLQSLIHHQNQGVRFAAIKCVQVFILLQSRSEGDRSNSSSDINIALVRADHRILKVDQLLEEALSMVKIMESLLKAPDMTSPTITATLNSLVPLMKRRPQFVPELITALINWNRPPLSQLSSVQMRNVDKSVKLVFITLIRSEQLSSQRTELINAFGAVGGDAAGMFQSRSQKLKERELRERERRESSEERRSAERNTSKRSLPDPTNVSAEKRQRMGTESNVSQTNLLAGFDLETLPLPMVAEFCLAILQNTTVETLTERLPMVYPALNAATTAQAPAAPPLETKVATPPQIVGARSPDMHGVKIEPSSSYGNRSVSTPTGQGNTPEPDMIKNEGAVSSEANAGFKTITAVGRNPLPSAQERVIQSLKMQPYALAAPPEFDRRQKLEMLKLAVQRILEAEKLSQQNLPIIDTTQDEDASRRQAAVTFNSPLKTTWILLIAKLVAKGVQIGKSSEDPSDGTNTDTKMDTDNLDDNSSEVDELRDMLLDFIVENLPYRQELAVQWMYEEMRMDQHYANSQDYQPKYFHWLIKLIKAALPSLRNDDRSMSKLLLDAPDLNAEVVGLLKGDMERRPERYKVTIQTLHDLALFRPPVRSYCLDVLLEYCINRDNSKRAFAILDVKKWVPDHAISPIIEEFSVRSLRRLLDDPPEKVKEDGMEPAQAEPNGASAMDESGDLPKVTSEDTQVKEENVWERESVIPHLELYFALCLKKPELLESLFDVYINTTIQVQRIIRQHITGLIRNIGMHSPKLLEIIGNFAPGGETLIVRILVVLCDTVRPTPELVDVVKKVYQERNLDAKFLIPVISGFNKDDIKQHMPKIIGLLNGTEAQRKIVRKVFSRIISDSGNVSAHMNAVELLVVLHNTDQNVSPKQAIEAINICFSMTDVFTSDIISKVLQHLMEQPKIPLLFMVTLIRSVAEHPDLVNLVLILLQKLISKRVWTSPKLWEGFVKCIQKTYPQSMKVVANLPKTQLMDVLTKVPGIATGLREFAEQNGLGRVLVTMNEMGLIEEEQE
ncbi:Symplekin tight junction protein C terminal-domain-containing protein [Umbelopsis sp. AD052]|nr:Symplekin tight junction protein C terminal-domain-containing protein [Umbelopsis sp. AD052]